MAGPVAVSFEFFPPGDESMAAAAVEVRHSGLRHCSPKFVSVTYGADGSTRARTHECVLRIMRETDLTVAPHLTCVGASRNEVLQIAAGLLAPRGAAPGGVARRRAGGQSGRGRTLSSAAPADLPMRPIFVAGLAAVGKFEVSVAAYPEGHPESGSVEADLENLRRKVDAGASRAITQFFFDTDLFLRYRDRCAAAGIPVRLVPGILPITRFPQLLRFARTLRGAVPDVAAPALRRVG